MEETKQEKDIDELFDRVRKVEQIQIEDSINLKLISNNLEEFLKVFKGHDEKEMDKYSEIQKVIQEHKDEATDLKNKVDIIITSQDNSAKRLDALEKTKQEFTKKAWQLSGALTVLGLLGGGILYILNLLAKLQAYTGG